jgi:hypothetical protein
MNQSTWFVINKQQRTEHPLKPWSLGFRPLFELEQAIVHLKQMWPFRNTWNSFNQCENLTTPSSQIKRRINAAWKKDIGTKGGPKFSVSESGGSGEPEYSVGDQSEITDHFNSLHGDLKESNSQRNAYGAQIASLEPMFGKRYDFMIEKVWHESLHFAIIEKAIFFLLFLAFQRDCLIESSF